MLKKLLVLIICFVMLFLFIVYGNTSKVHAVNSVFNLQGVENEKSYFDEKLTITFEGRGWLNGNPFNTGTTISENGKYDLLLNAEGVTEKIVFYIYKTIYTYDDLCTIKTKSNGYYVLGNDIDCQMRTDHYFTYLSTDGLIDGNHYTLINLKYGICGTNYGIIKNINVYNTEAITYDFIPDSCIGGICGTNTNWGQITNCSFEGDITRSGSVNFGLGGICESNEGLIESCYTKGTFQLKGSASDSPISCGGICARNTNEVILSYSHSNLYINSGIGGRCGGICGYGYNTIRDCYFYGEINANGENMSCGAIAGAAYYDAVFEQCYYVSEMTKINGEPINESNENGLSVNSVTEAANKFDAEYSKQGFKDEDGNYVYAKFGSGIEPGLNLHNCSYSYTSGIVTLNGEDYLSDTKIVLCGNYVLIHKTSNNYSKTIEFVIEPIYDGIINDEIYYENISPSFDGSTEVLLDGQNYDNSTINTIGKHKIEIKGVSNYSKIINFEIGAISYDIISDEYSYKMNINNIHPDTVIKLDDSIVAEIDDKVVGNHNIKIINGDYLKEISYVIEAEIVGVEDGLDYIGEISINVSCDNITLNNLPFTNGNNVSVVGKYALDVEGVNGYKKTIQFTLSPIITNLTNGGIFEGMVQPGIIGGKLTLDNEEYDGISAITEPGDHQIKIIGINGYSKAINFTINLIDSGIANEDNLELKGTYTFTGGTATLDGKEYISGTEIDEIGNHTILVTGSTGFSKTINFAIKPSVKNINNLQSYNGSVTPNIAGGLITLDNQQYDGISKINDPGNHQIVVTGVNDYELKIDFTINLVDSGIENESIYYDYVSYNCSGGIVNLDGKPYEINDEINLVGKHEIVITGSTGFEKKYVFEIKAANYTITENDYSWSFKLTNKHRDTIIKIDGNVINSDYEEQKIGNHTLIITSNNDYLEIINYSIKEEFQSEIVNEVYLLDATKYAANVYVDGALVDGETRIDKNGSHTVLFEGSNGYLSEYTITYNNPNYKYAFILIIPTSLVLMGIVFLIVKRRRVI